MNRQLLKSAAPLISRNIKDYGALSSLSTASSQSRTVSTSAPAFASPAAEFVVSKVDALVNWARTGSMWPMTFGLGKLYLSSLDLCGMGKGRQDISWARPSPLQVLFLAGYHWCLRMHAFGMCSTDD